MRKLPLIALAAALMSAAPAAMAMTATQKVEKEITRTAPDGTVTTERVEAKLVTPGEKVVYTLDIMNTNAAAATDLVLAMPVPVHVKYIEGSADRDGAVVRYSADGGKTFAGRDALWKITDSIEAGSTDFVAFKARLR